MSERWLRAGARVALAMALIGAPAGLHAQALSCRVPGQVPRATPVVPDPGEVRRMAVTGYTLALSWSPQYCAEHAAPDRTTQCNGALGRFGFILHGLWPDGEGGRWPQYCAPGPALPRSVIAENLCAAPSVRLLQHMWAKHGTCMGRDPDRYLDTARGLFNAVRWPDMRSLARRRGLTAGDFMTVFARANPAVPFGALRVQLGRGGELEEMWLCLDNRLKPAVCAKGKPGARSSAPMRITPP